MQTLVKFANKYNKKRNKRQIGINSLFVRYQFDLIGYFINFHVSNPVLFLDLPS